MKKFSALLVFYLLLAALPLPAQKPVIDSLTTLLKQHPQPDTIRAQLLNDLAYEYKANDPEQSRRMAEEALRLARSLKYRKVEATALRRIGSYYYQQADYTAALRAFAQAQQIATQINDHTTLAWAYNGKGTVYHSQSDYPQALQNYLQAVQIFEKTGKPKEAASIMGNVGVLYKEMDELPQALTAFTAGLKLQEQLGDKSEIARFLNNIGGVYMEQHNYARAQEAFTRSLSLTKIIEDKHLEALVLRNLIELKASQGNYRQGLNYGFKSLALYRELGETEGLADATYQIAYTYLHSSRPDSALAFALQSLNLAHQIGFKRNIHNTYEVLAQAYAAQNKFPEAYKAQQSYIAYKDSLTGEDKKQLIAGLKFKYELDKKQDQIAILTKDKQLQAEKARHQSQQKYALAAGLFLVLVIAGTLVRYNQQQYRKNKLLQMQKTEIDEQANKLRVQRDQLEETLNNLKQTQQQLIQKEKMASLGELTAGIAHEIQNPLNFVNNFSDLSVELVGELQQELAAGDAAETAVIVENIKHNLQKILHHGKRADSIVKNMLQHSRGGYGQKQLININVLAEEYLRLSYHGLRAKDKEFNAKLITNFDSAIMPVAVVPQDISRVLLNLFNNAFYATQQKKIQLNGQYQPEVQVSTCQKDGQLEIRVRDNGSGIPNNIKNKIFQPFFTTKPTGQGTGLGLSLSYDIITKGHGGELKVESRNKEFTEFIIELPVS